MDHYLEPPTYHIGSGVGKKKKDVPQTPNAAVDQKNGPADDRASKPSNDLYPLSQAKLKDLSSGGKTVVYVGKRPNIELVLQMPTRLLTYFVPRSSLQVLDPIDDTLQLLVLQYCSRPAAAWVINWMLRGGKPLKDLAEKRDKEDAVEVLLQRLHIATILSIPGELREQLSFCLENAFRETRSISPRFIHWIYTHTSPKVAPSLRPVFAAHMLDAALFHNLLLHGTCPHDCRSSHALLRADLAKGLEGRDVVRRISQIQKTYPLTVSQIRLIYNFTEAGSNLRKLVARDLFALIDDHKAANPETYRILGTELLEFDEDMFQAKGDRASRVGSSMTWANKIRELEELEEQLEKSLDKLEGDIDARTTSHRDFVAALRKDINAGLVAPAKYDKGSMVFLSDGTVIASSGSTTSETSRASRRPSEHRTLCSMTNNTSRTSSTAASLVTLRGSIELEKSFELGKKSETTNVVEQKKNKKSRKINKSKASLKLKKSIESAQSLKSAQSFKPEKDADDEGSPVEIECP